MRRIADGAVADFGCLLSKQLLPRALKIGFEYLRIHITFIHAKKRKYIAIFFVEDGSESITSASLRQPPVQI